MREYEAATAAASCAAGGDASNEPTLDAERDRVTMVRPGRRLGMTSERREAARPVPDTECVTDLCIWLPKRNKQVGRTRPQRTTPHTSARRTVPR